MFASHVGGHSSISVPLNLRTDGRSSSDPAEQGKKGAGSSCLLSRKALPNQRESGARGWLFLIF